MAFLQAKKRYQISLRDPSADIQISLDNSIKRHRGSISLESEVGKGTVFTLELPSSEKRFSENRAPHVD